MDLTTITRTRFSCRSFRPEPVSAERLEAILEAARWAPSAGNLQPWRFVVVQRGELRQAVASAAYGQSFIASAPTVVVVCAVPRESARVYGARGSDLYCLQDTAAATQNLLLAAAAADLGACWVGAFDEDAVARALELDVGWRPVAVVPIGHPAERSGRRSRRALEAVTVWME